MRTPGVMAVVIALWACGQPLGAADHMDDSSPPRNAGAHCASDEECDDPRLYCIDAYIDKRICVSKIELGNDCFPSHPERCFSGFCNRNTLKCSMPLGPGMCDVVADCPVPGICAQWACVQGRCAQMDTPASTPLPQNSGDCSRIACDGSGHFVVIEDDLDVPESTFCRPAGCSGGVPWLQQTPLGTPCGPGNEVCISGECRVPSLQIAFDPPSTAPGEVRVLTGGTEIARCTASCSVEVTVGQDYVVEATSAGRIFLDGPQCPNNGSSTSCTVTGTYLSTVRVAFFGD